MKTTNWLCGLALLASVLGGCAADASRDEGEKKESVDVTRAADIAPYPTGVAVLDTAVARSTSPSNLLAGPWRFVSSDLTPSTAYAIHGDAIDLDFQGYFSWNGTWASGYQGYTFEQPAPLAPGATYVLTVDVTHSNVGLPVVVKASLSGAGAAQQQMSFGNGVLTFTFTVASDPGCAPVVDLVAHPVLGQIGPIQGTGIGIESYTLTASLAEP